MFDLKLYSSNVIEIEMASCVGYIGYISANIVTKKEEEKRVMERKKKKKGQEKREGKRNGEGKWEREREEEGKRVRGKGKGRRMERKRKKGRRRGRERKMGKGKHSIWQVTLHTMLYESIMHRILHYPHTQHMAGDAPHHALLEYHAPKGKG